MFAVPVLIDAPASVGCNRLIRDGAGLASDAWDILRTEARFPDKLRREGTQEAPCAGLSGPAEDGSPSRLLRR